MKNSVYDCTIFELSQINNRAGNITPIYNDVNIPFQTKRISFIYDIPGGQDRGAHAHKKCHQFLVAGSGSFYVELDDGINKSSISLNRPFFGLYVPPGIWAAQKGFSTGSVCLVLASHIYDEQDYIQEYSEFKKLKSE